jgi:hypothetical protein
LAGSGTSIAAKEPQWRGQLGQDHEHTLMAAHYLARALLELGRYAEARVLNQDTWERHRQAQGPDHRSTLRTAHILAADLRELGEVAAARDLDRDTLQRRQRVLGDDHPDTLNSARNLGEACVGAAGFSGGMVCTAPAATPPGEPEASWTPRG